MKHFSLPAAILFATSVASVFAASPRSDDSIKGQARIMREVRHELVMLPNYGVFDNLTYHVKGSTVRLSGQVTQPILKDNAAKSVKGIEGVEKVDNNIEVLPLSPMDDRIRLAAYRAIYGYPSLSQYAIQAVPSIHIIVKNGNITLVGVAANEMDRMIAEIQAKSVPGAFGVVNELMVENRSH